MKVRDSGMPDETYWESLFDIESIMQRIGPAKHAIDAVEFGSGYGTFSLPIARRISGTLFALDLETELIHRLKQRAESQNVNNITVTEMCPLSTMKDLHQLIAECEKILTF